MRNRILVALIVLTAFVGGIALWQLIFARGPVTPPPGLEAVILPEPKTIAPFNLTDQHGNPYGEEQLKGHWSFVFFGYTHCPDICPTTLVTLGNVSKGLEQEPISGEDTRFILVSVDPKRDRPDHLRGYLEYFDPKFVGITGKKEQIDNLVRQVGAVYMFEGDTSGDEYIVNHSATIYLIDPEGRFYARISPPHSPERIIESYRRIRGFHG